MISRSLKVSLYLGLVFASGIVVGAVGSQVYSARTVAAKAPAPRPRTPEEFRSRYINTMRKRLNLNESQVGELNSILDDARLEWREVRQKYRPELDAIEKKQLDRTMKMLDQAQRAEYQKFLDERRAEKERRRPPQPHPGC